MLRRREFLQAGLAGAGALAFGPAFWRDALAAAPATPGVGPFGPLQAPDANGIMLPNGFSSRVIARGLQPVPGTAYPWHIFSDGQATFAQPDGGWILVSNCEAPPDAGGGAEAIRFRADGSTAGAHRILGGTQNNCAGGPTPWGTWLSCEEHDGGRVWECDPTGAQPARVHPAMGVFSHEAAAVDPAGRRVYLTEDDGSGGFYRFTPDAYPDLSRGLLEIASVQASGAVRWLPVPDPSASSGPTRSQVPGYTPFRRGEGIWFDSGVVYVATTSDERIHAYDTVGETIEVIYDAKTLSNPPLQEVDNITVARSGDLFVCEDAGDLSMGVITPDRVVADFLRLTGAQHGDPNTAAASELTGVTFNPSGDRMYFSSQRAFGVGVIYEITGPFRPARPPVSGPSTPLGFLVTVDPDIPIPRVLGLGTPMAVRVAEPAELLIILRSTVARRVRLPGRLPRYGVRRVPITISAARFSVPAGSTGIDLRPGVYARRLLPGRRPVWTSTLAVTATYANGRSDSDTRTVRLIR